MLVQLVAFAMLALGGYGLGQWLGRKKRWWVLGFVGPLLVIGGVCLARRVVAMSFVWPLGWLVRPDVNWAVMALAISLIFMTLAPRLSQRRQRVAVWVVMGAMEVVFGVLPVVMPVVVRNSLLATRTRVLASGVCVQTHEYTCGAAAAVTALRALGVRGNDVAEGTIGVDAGTAPTLGTDPGALAEALNRRFADRGVRADYQWLGTLEKLAQELDQGKVAVVEVTWGLGLHHYVAVRGINPLRVIVGDPASGLMPMRKEEFAELWNGAAVVIGRNADR